jgi:hypothetical protein
VYGDVLLYDAARRGKYGTRKEARGFLRPGKICALAKMFVFGFKNQLGIAGVHI